VALQGALRQQIALATSGAVLIGLLAAAEMPNRTRKGADTAKAGICQARPTHWRLSQLRWSAKALHCILQ
jgi:hypothetical protein